MTCTKCNSFILKRFIQFACTNLGGCQKEWGNFLNSSEREGYPERGKGGGFQPWRKLWAWEYKALEGSRSLAENEGPMLVSMKSPEKAINLLRDSFFSVLGVMRMWLKLEKLKTLRGNLITIAFLLRPYSGIIFTGLVSGTIINRGSVFSMKMKTTNISKSR